MRNTTRSKTKPAKGIAELADKLIERDETAARILYVLRSSRGVFFGTATDLSRKIVESLDGDISCRLFSARSVGKALTKFLPVFKDYLITHKPRLRAGRRYYAFDGLQPGVEL